MGYKNDDRCILKAYEDERLFVLMARDPAAPKVILHWIAKSIETQPPGKIREALECAIEMQNKGDEFRNRVAQAKKEAAAAEERYEFERWKKTRDGAVNVSSFDEVFKNSRQILTHEEAIQKVASNFEVNFARNFANWLDAQGVSDKIDEAHRMGHGFNNLLEEFIKSVPSRT